MIDLLALGESDRTLMDTGEADTGGQSAKDMGFSMSQTYIAPSPIVYHEAGTLSGSAALTLDLLDKKVLTRKSLIMIATQDGKKLSRKEINRYKMELKKHNRKVK